MELDVAAVARRALCLGTIIMRCEFEQVVQAVPNRSMTGLHQGMVDTVRAWLEREGLTAALSAAERAVLDKPLGEWSKQEIIDASWRVEALGALLWALSVRDTLPPYDVEVQQQPAVRALHMGRPIAEFVDQAVLRPEADLVRARDVAELWHWRCRTMQIQRENLAPPPEGYTYEEIIARAAQAAHAAGDLPQPINGDFPVNGKAFADLDEDEWRRAMSIARERQYALNWLCGYADDWDEVRTDT